MSNLTGVLKPKSVNCNSNMWTVTFYVPDEEFALKLKDELINIQGKGNGRLYGCALAEVDESEQLIETPKAIAKVKPYGDAAKVLRFDAEGFLPAIRVKEFCWIFGTDTDYQEFCRTQPCAKSKKDGSMIDPVVYAHVRRSKDSGTAFKADYMGIPLLNSIHLDQHQHGEITTLGSKDWMEKARDEHISKWIGSKFGVDSLGFVNPRAMVQKCIAAGKLHLIPLAYRKFAE